MRKPEEAVPQLHKQEEAAGPEHAQQDTAATDKKPGKQQFQILADEGAYYAGIPATLKVGHAWVRLLDGEQVTSWGFWPKGKVQLQGLTSVPGEVRSPDTVHSPTAIHTYDIDDEQAARVVKTAEAVRAAPPDYNLFTHNCVHFSAELAGAAGVAMPKFDDLLGIANPHTLAKNIAKLNHQSGEDAMEHALPADGDRPA